MNDFFLELFEYNYHTNQKLIQHMLSQGEKIFPKNIKLFSHIINAHGIWNSRIFFESDAFGTWDIHDVNRWSDLEKINWEKSQKILSEKSLDTLIPYKTSKGEPFSNTIRDILYHVINHGNYHRAQINQNLVLEEQNPIITDYIFYKRTS